MVAWCRPHNLILKVDKTCAQEHSLSSCIDSDSDFIDGTAVERLSSLKYLGAHITKSNTTSTTAQAEEHRSSHHTSCGLSSRQRQRILIDVLYMYVSLCLYLLIRFIV